MARRWIIVLGSLTIAGCALGSPPARFAVREPVGPPSRALLETHDAGRLIVYSADALVAPPDSDLGVRSDYTIRASDRATLERVANQSGPFGSEPETVLLPPGRYLVDARATNFGRVEVPVQIEDGRTTVVHLDGEAEPHAGAGWVRLPDGQVIGALAD